MEKNSTEWCKCEISFEFDLCSWFNDRAVILVEE